MANFKQAIKWLEEGRKIVGKYFVDGDYIYLGDNGQAFYWDSNEGKGSWMQFTIDCFTKEDWQIYEEKEKVKAPAVFIERAALCTIEGIRAVCGTDEEYDEYVRKVNQEGRK